MAFTFFFRDAQTLELAIENALPSLQGRAFIHVWDAGCAHGPEPYTLAILLRERMSDYVFRNVRIHATDIDSSFAAQVTQGVFTEEEVKRVPPEILRRYFRPAAPASVRPGRVGIAYDRSVEQGAEAVRDAPPASSASACVEVVPELRAKVSFSQHDLLSLRPVGQGLSLIVCKNVLLHFNEGQRIEVLRMFHEALQPGGTLVMEQTQALPERLAPFFRQIAAHAQVYRKVEPALVEHPAQQTAPHRRCAHRAAGPPDQARGVGEAPAQSHRERCWWDGARACPTPQTV